MNDRPIDLGLARRDVLVICIILGVLAILTSFLSGGSKDAPTLPEGALGTASSPLRLSVEATDPRFETAVERVKERVWEEIIKQGIPALCAQEITPDLKDTYRIASVRWTVYSHEVTVQGDTYIQHFRNDPGMLLAIGDCPETLGRITSIEAEAVLRNGLVIRFVARCSPRIQCEGYGIGNGIGSIPGGAIM